LANVEVKNPFWEQRKEKSQTSLEGKKGSFEPLFDKKITAANTTLSLLKTM